MTPSRRTFMMTLAATGAAVTANRAFALAKLDE